MAVATAEPHKAEPKHEETEKERADKALAEHLEKQGPSGLIVEAPRSETDLLRDQGFPVAEIAVAPLPGGGPSTQPGMSAGAPPPTAEVIQEGLDEQEKRLEEANKEREKKLDERKKAEKARLDALKKQQQKK